MRDWSVLAVSSALLFLSVGPVPHHIDRSFEVSTQATSAGGLLITEFYPAALSQDEYFVVSCDSVTVFSLLGWSVTDGEGTITFSSGLLLLPGDSACVSANGTAFEKAFGRAPTYSLPLARLNGTVAVSGTFRLADSGDSLGLISASGDVVDCVRYGISADLVQPWTGEPVPALKPGEVCRRSVSGSLWADTDCASDWCSFREFKYGYTAHEPLEADVLASHLTAFVSPDCSLEVVIDAIDRTERVIRLCGYELSSSAVCNALIRAVARGVQVRILVDGAPAGGMADRQITCLSALHDAGAEASVVNGNISEDVVRHIGALHCKYMVVDSELVIVLSENFVESGLPEDKLGGNRGWGVRISSMEVASYLAALFDSDARASRPDVLPWDQDSRAVRGAVVPPPPPAEHSKGPLAPFVSSKAAHVKLIISPDGSPEAPFLEPLLRGASGLDIEQFQVDLLWDDRWTKELTVSPLLDAVSGAMKQGATVRMIFDSSWFNVAGNQPAVDYMNSLVAGNQACGFRPICNGSQVSVVHNKGAIMDGSMTLVSSNNWGRASFARNRELAVLIVSEEVAGYFRRAFEMDWDPDRTAPSAEAGDDLDVRVGSRAVLNASLSSDDRVVANYSWDLDGDGSAELYGESVAFVPRREGTYRITLTVEDAWGNADEDELVLTATSAAAGAGSPPMMPLLVLLAGISGLGMGLLGAHARGSARKVNHPPPPDE